MLVGWICGCRTCRYGGLTVIENKQCPAKWLSMSEDPINVFLDHIKTEESTHNIRLIDTAGCLQSQF